MTWELRFVFDAGVSVNNREAKADALAHLRKMPEPRAWVQDQIGFDKDLVDARKISKEAGAHRHERWRILLQALAESPA